MPFHFCLEQLEQKIISLKKKYPHRPTKALISLVFWCIMYFIRAMAVQIKHLLSVNPSSNIKNKQPKILFILGGGVGDIIIASTYLKEFYKYIGGGFLFSIRTDQRTQVVASIFRNSPWLESIVQESQYSDYDIVIQLSRFPRIIYKNPRLNIEKTSKINDLLDEYENFYQVRSKLCQSTDFDTLGIMYSLMNGDTRRSQPDIGHKLGLSDITRPIMVIKENAFDVLTRTEIENRTYITIQRGTNEAYKEKQNIREWSKDYYNKLVRIIHDNFPSLSIVQVGRKKSDSNLEGIDIDLRGKTSFDELKAVLKYSALHIDGECGMVHLTHTLGGRSAVFFGQTRVDFCGYPENINVKAKDACPLWCEWVTDDWQAQCLRGFDVPPCMEQLTPELFFEAIREHLHDVTTEKPPRLCERDTTATPEGTLLFIGDFADDAFNEWIRPENTLLHFSMNLTPEQINNKKSQNIDADYADILNIPMKKNSCDAVFCSQEQNLSLYALREVTRILKMGGVLKTPDGRSYIKELSSSQES